MLEIWFDTVVFKSDPNGLAKVSPPLIGLMMLVLSSVLAHVVTALATPLVTTLILLTILFVFTFLPALPPTALFVLVSLPRYIKWNFK